MSLAVRVGSSFRDPSGFVFKRHGVVHREIAPSYAPHYERLFSCGLYDQLVGEGLLLPHDELDVRMAFSDRAYKVIRPAQLEFVSHPYEWCFSQLKDAALATLRIQRLALARGMTLKDASAYNIQLHAGRTTLIDTLSFECLRPGRPWVAYRQFCQHFLAPLALMSRVDVRLGQLLRVHLDGLPLDLASRLLPFTSRFSVGLGLHVHAHAAMQRRYEGRTVPSKVVSGGMSLKAVEALTVHLEQTIQSLRPAVRRTEWDDYYQANHNYGAEGLAAKVRLVKEFLGAEPPQVVWDLGANDGRFSRLALESGARTVVAWDIDPNCVEANYRRVAANGERGHFPLLLDLTNPSPAIGWAHRERPSLADRGPADTLLALGLIHHLAIANNLPLAHIVSYLKTLARRVVIEWVPKEDSQVRKLLGTRADIFPDYEQPAFEETVAREFRVLRKESLEATCRTLYLLEAPPA